MIQLAALLAIAWLPCSPPPLTVGGSGVQDEATWRALPLPALCHEAGAVARMAPLEYGRHLVRADDDLVERSPSAAPQLPVPMLLGLLSDEARRLDLQVEFQPTAPPLLARGSRADLDALEAVLADLDRAGQTLEIGVEAWLTPGASPAGAYPDAAAVAAATAERAPWAETHLRSGAGAVLGTREERMFLLEYFVELATDSGVADPVLGSALLGTTLHLTATRTDAGRRVHVEGFLDLAELLSLDAFDTDTYDIGSVQQPRIGVVQVAFSGTVASGGVLSVAFSGAPLGAPDQTLWLRLTCAPDEPATGAWRGLDVALLERRIVDLPLPHPGAGLASVELPSVPRVTSESLPASALAQVFSRRTGRGGDLRPIWSPGYLLAPTADAGWSEVDALVRAAQGARSAGGTLTLQHGALEVRLPVSEGVPTRVFVGVETTLLSEYDVAVATEVWLPQPVIVPVFDGLLVQGLLRGSSFRGTTWTADSRPATTLDRDQVRLGRMQLSHRGFRTARWQLTASAGQALLMSAAPTPEDSGATGAAAAGLTGSLEPR